MVRIIFLFCILFAQTLKADPFPNANGQADNKVHYVCWDQSGNAPSELVSYLNYVNSTVYANSGVFAYPYPCVPLVDAIYSDLLIGNDLGVRVCKLKVGNLCVESDVLINKQLIDAQAANHGLTPSESKEKTWCHETGHSFGLAHSSLNSNNCMKEGWSSLSQHDIHQMLTHLSNL